MSELVAKSQSEAAEAVVDRRGAGRPMDPGTRTTIEGSLNTDLGSVRIHDDANAREGSTALNAKAFTHKEHIFLGSGSRDTNLSLMAHESAHVVQQRGGRTADTVQPSSSGGVWGAVLEKFASWARAIPGYFLLTVIIGRDPITGNAVERSGKNLLRGAMGLVPGGEALFKRLEKSGAIDRAFKWLEAEWKKLDLGWTAIKRLFGRAWDSLSWTDAFRPWNAFNKVMAVFGPPLQRVVRFAGNVAKKILEFIFEGFIMLAGPLGQRIVKIFRKSKGAFLKIVKDPVGFLSNLMSAVGLGFKMFVGNIWEHLKKGLMGWLFGALEGAGLELPKTFDAKGILSIALQVLGLTWTNVRKRLVKKIGEKWVARLEKGVEIVRVLATEGIAGAKKLVGEAMEMIKGAIIGAIQNWVVTKIIKSAVTKIISMLNPVGAIIQAIIQIYNTVAFFVERINQILDLVESIADSVTAIATGKLKPAATYIEKTLGRTVPVIISFLARLVGLGGISEKIKKVIEKIQAPVNKMIDKVIDWVLKMGRKLMAGGKKAVGKVVGWWKARKKVKMGGKDHAIYYPSKKGKLTLASTPQVLENWLKDPDKGEKVKKEEPDVYKEIIKKHDEVLEVRKKIDDPKKSMHKTLGTDWANALSGLAAALSKVTSVGEQVVPESQRTWKPKNYVSMGGDDVGHSVTAKPLTLRKGPGDPGTEPGSSYPKWYERLRLHRPGAYIQGHLLNHNVHGPGKAYNLAPISGSFNSTMESQAEEEVKTQVLSNNRVLEYSAKVTYHSRQKKADHPNAHEAELRLPTTWKIEAWTMKLKAKKRSAADAQKWSSWTRDKKVVNWGDTDPNVNIDAPAGSKAVSVNSSEKTLKGKLDHPIWWYLAKPRKKYGGYAGLDDLEAKVNRYRAELPASDLGGKDGVWVTEAFAAIRATFNDDGQLR